MPKHKTRSYSQEITTSIVRQIKCYNRLQSTTIDLFLPLEANIGVKLSSLAQNRSLVTLTLVISTTKPVATGTSTDTKALTSHEFEGLTNINNAVEGQTSAAH